MSFGKCSVCDSDVLYNPEMQMAKCSICGKEEMTYILCEEGHYVCADCCAKEVMDNIRKYAPQVKYKNPVDVGEYMLAKCGLSGHTPHTIAAVSFLIAVKNLTGHLTDDDIEEGIERAYKIPAGWCGYYGACGAGIGLGVAFSVILRATPSSDKERSLANIATSDALRRIAKLGGPCCCVASVRAAMIESLHLSEKYLNLKFPSRTHATKKCWASNLQHNCKHEKCAYFAQISEE